MAEAQEQGHSKDLYYVLERGARRKMAVRRRVSVKRAKQLLAARKKWSGKTGLEIIITGPSADLGLRGPRAARTDPPYGVWGS